jgi:hypothetical protein
VAAVTSDLVHETAFAIYREFSRERDPDRARRRFETMPEIIREQFYAEAKAAARVVETFYRSEAA